MHIFQESVSVLRSWFLPHYSVISHPGPGSCPQNPEVPINWKWNPPENKGSALTREPLRPKPLQNSPEQPSAGSQNCILVLANVGCSRKEHSMNCSLFENFSPHFWLTCLQFPQVSVFLEDENHVYFIVFPHILAPRVAGVLLGKGVMNVTYLLRGKQQQHMMNVPRQRVTRAPRFTRLSATFPWLSA